MPPNVGGKYMQNHMGWLGRIGFCGLVGAANAQTPSPATATTQFDGTYAPVSATTLNETFMAGGTRQGQCPERTAEPPTRMPDPPRYSNRPGNGTARLKVEGTVRTHG